MTASVWYGIADALLGLLVLAALFMFVASIYWIRGERPVAPYRADKPRVVAGGMYGAVVQGTEARNCIATWEHMWPAFAPSKTWTEMHSELCEAVTETDLSTRLVSLVCEYAFVETPVYAYLAQVHRLPQHRVVAKNYSAARLPAVFVATLGSANGTFRNGKTREEIGDTLKACVGLKISVLGRLMSPTICLLKELEQAQVTWRFGPARANGVELIEHRNTDEQFNALLDGSVDLANVVFPATDRLVDQSDDLARNLTIVPVASRLWAEVMKGASPIEGDVANVVVMGLHVMDLEFIGRATTFLRARNSEMLVMEQQSLEELRPSGELTPADGRIHTDVQDPPVLGDTVHWDESMSLPGSERWDLAVQMFGQMQKAKRYYPDEFPNVDCDHLAELMSGGMRVPE